MAQYIAFFLLLLAAFIRGYSGFGFAVIAIIALNLILNPVQSVPVVLALDILCSLGLARQAIKQFDRQTFWYLCIGSVFGIPIGLCVLFYVPAIWLKLAISIVILFMLIVIALNWRIQNNHNVKAAVYFGFGSGLATASASIGGPIVLIYMLSSSLSSAAQCSTLILFFLLTEPISLLGDYFVGTIDSSAILWFVKFFLPVLIFVLFGQWVFNRYPVTSFRNISLPIIGAVAMLGIWSSVNQLIS